MSVQRFLFLFVAMIAAGFVTRVILGRLGVHDDVGNAASLVAMATAAWLIAREWIQKHLLLGRSFATWFFGIVAISALMTCVARWLFGRA